LSKHPLIIILEDVRSALNVGAIFRTADAAGAQELILTGITPYPPHPRIPKTALGATENVSWKHIPLTSEVITELHAKKFNIVAVEVTFRAVSLYNYEFPDKTAIIFGNEITGVSQETLANVDQTVKIPMYGIKESLNVATTVGIVAFEIIRQWEFK